MLPSPEETRYLSLKWGCLRVLLSLLGEDIGVFISGKRSVASVQEEQDRRDQILISEQKLHGCAVGRLETDSQFVETPRTVFPLK